MQLTIHLFTSASKGGLTMKNFTNRILITGFLAIIFGMCIWTGKIIYWDKKSFSDFENRELALNPVLTIDTIKSGKYFKDTELHFTDHIAARDRFIETYTKLQLKFNRTFVNNNYVADDGFILSAPTKIDMRDQIKHSVNELENLQTQFPKTEFYFLLAPSKLTAFSYKYPPYVDRGYDQKHRDYFVQELQKINFPIIDVLPAFQKEFTHEQLEDLYFKTDHHWNMKGAFYAYEQTMNHITNESKIFKGNAVNRDDYKITTEKPNGQFIGSWNKQLYNLIETPETISYVQLKQNPNMWDNYTVYLGPKSEESMQMPMKEFFAADKNKLSPDYSSVYQTDYAQINILNPDAKNKLHAVIIKDSYADATYPLFAQEFEQTTFIDPRFAASKNVKQDLEKLNADIVLFLYNDTSTNKEMYQFENKE